MDVEEVLGVEETLQVAIEAREDVELTIDGPDGPPFQLKVTPVLSNERNGLLTYELADGRNQTIYSEFISHAEIV